MSTSDVGETTAVVLDIDGVLADVRHRLHHLDRKPKDWVGFFGHMKDDGLLAEGAALAQQFFGEGHRIFYVTGRPTEYSEVTKAWLDFHRLPPGELIMRRRGDYRPAAKVKTELVNDLAKTYTIVAIVDDDPAVVAAMRSHALPVRQATWHELPDHGNDPAADASAHQLLFDAQEEDGAT